MICEVLVLSQKIEVKFPVNIGLPCNSNTSNFDRLESDDVGMLPSNVLLNNDKKSKFVSGRRPFGQDTERFNYDYDSDEDWEEEEQGESLSDEEKDKEDDEEDVMDVSNFKFKKKSSSKDSTKWLLPGQKPKAHSVCVITLCLK